MSVVHWDDLERERGEVDPLASWLIDLGTPAGSVTVGITRWQVDPGKRSTPAHVEYAEEEIFYVLGGSGLSWQDGETFEIGTGDVLVHLREEEAHTVVAGPDGIDYLAFGQRAYAVGTLLPRANVIRFPGAELQPLPRPPTAWEREVAAGELELPPPSPRPRRILNVADTPAEYVRAQDHGGSKFVVRNLGLAAGSQITGLRQIELEPGKMGYPPHCHAAEEEMLVVLDGAGTLLLGHEEHAVGRGHVVARPAGTGVAHAFVAGDAGLTYLAYGTREPNDITYYPRSGKVSFRGVGVIGRIEQLDYWLGEE
jgi:uncharacterized cupin superfamily protein